MKLMIACVTVVRGGGKRESRAREARKDRTREDSVSYPCRAHLTSKLPPPPPSTACHAGGANDKRCHQEISQINDLNSITVSFLRVYIAWRESITFLVCVLIMSCLADVLKFCRRVLERKCIKPIKSCPHFINSFIIFNLVVSLGTFGAFGTVTKM